MFKRYILIIKVAWSLNKKFPKRNRLHFELWRVKKLGGVLVICCCSYFHTFPTPANFQIYGNIKFQYYWLGIKTNLVVIAAKCLLQSCNSFMISFRFFSIKHWVVYLVSSYLFSEKYVVFNLPPQTYGKKDTQM